MHIQVLLMVNWDDTIKLITAEKRLLWAKSVVFVFGRVGLHTSIGDNSTSDLKSVLLILGQVI